MQQIEHSSHFVEARQPRQVVVYLMQNSSLRGRPPPIIFARIVRPMNALQLCANSFHTQKTLQQTFFNPNAILNRKRPFCVFEPPLGAQWQPTMIILRSLDFLLVLIKLFSLGDTDRLRRYERISVQIRRFCSNGGRFDPKFHVEGVAPPTIFFSENYAK